MPVVIQVENWACMRETGRTPLKLPHDPRGAEQPDPLWMVMKIVSDEFLSRNRMHWVLFTAVIFSSSRIVRTIKALWLAPRTEKKSVVATKLKWMEEFTDVSGDSIRNNTSWPSSKEWKSAGHSSLQWYYKSLTFLDKIRCLLQWLAVREAYHPDNALLHERSWIESEDHLIPVRIELT